MLRSSLAALACLRLFAFALHAQSPAQPPEWTFQVLPSQHWVDTKLNLQPEDVLRISASALPNEGSGLPACDPAGLKNVTDSKALPVASAPAGALIARLHDEATNPVLVGARSELKIESASHLFLGMNGSGSPVCGGGLTVKVERISGGQAAAATQTRGQQLKSQLGNAAQIFMQGQFGVGKTTADSQTNTALSGSGTSAAPSPLTISTKPLDASLIKLIDSLPRRVNDQFNNLGDMVNFVIIGSGKDVQATLEAANWHIADTSNTAAVVGAITQTYGNKDYLTMPMSILYLFGRKQDFGYEMAEPIAMVASRHHFRIWKAPFEWDGKEVWVGAGTHDIGFAKDRRNNSVTHKIDPAVDGERDNIGLSLQKTNLAKTISYYLPANPVQEAKNATGDSYRSDGRVLVVFLQ